MHVIDLLIIAIYFIAIIAIGFSRKTGENQFDPKAYLLAGRKLSLPGFVVTLVATWYGGILGIGENTYLHGLQTWTIFGLPYYLFALIFAFFIAGRINQLKSISLPDQFYQRYGSVAGAISAIYIFLLSSPAPYILSIGIIVNQITGLPHELSLVVITAISLSYIWNGGLKAVVRTDVLQFIVMFLGFIVLVFFSIRYTNSSIDIFRELPANFLSFTGGASLQYIFAWFFIALWTFVDPGFYQRCAAAKSPTTARNGILISIGFWFVFDMLTLFSGIYAKLLITNSAPTLAYIKLAELVLPPFAFGLFFIGILSVIMSSVDSFSFISANTFGRDILWRVQSRTEKDHQLNDDDSIPLIKKGLLVTATISLMLAISIPSVVELWYTLGSIIVPGLLLPFLISFTKKKMDVISLMVAPIFISILWVLIKNISGSYPLNLEPFYPGIFTSIIICSVKWLKK